ncbi:ATP-binding cassette domain-containing protein [Micromonospora sp. CA-248089]|uniref:ATP-binding cassette domain-containing protein n=1 Tax=Micromonospora sp. CA-248089 TaxID=3239960 RepID=UPI003D93F987
MTGPSPSPAIETVGLRKSFGDHVVLGGIDLTVPAGTVFALLGPNGAGKTTTVNILSTLLTPDGGEARVVGHDVVRAADKVRASIGVTGQFSAVDQLMTGEENLLLMAALQHLSRQEGRTRAAELIERFDLAGAAKKTVATYSGGMRRRLDLAMTLVGRPSVIFLDEPTTGLDPRGRRVMWDFVRSLLSEGVTIFLTTQYLEEADQLADRIAVLDDGRIVAAGTPAELKRLVPGGHIKLELADESSLTAAASVLPDGIPDGDDLTLTIPSNGDIAALREVLNRLEQAGVPAQRLSLTTPDLDDVFLALTGPQARKEVAR